MALGDLLDLLRRQADEQVRALLESADAEAERLLREGDEALAREERRALDEVERALRQEHARRRTEQARAARERRLRARRERLDAVAEAVRASLDEIEAAPAWPAVAAALARAVLDAGGGRELVVRCRPGTARWVAEAAPALTLEVADDAEPGLLARSPDGGLVIDARLAALYEGARPELEAALSAGGAP